MSIKDDYNSFMAEQKIAIGKEMIQFAMLDQEKRYVKPFRIFGNVYYAGDSWVCVHVIDTGEGLLLIDSGNAQATAMLIHSIWSLGFNPADIKWIILSHGHVDHIGGVNFLRKMFGCKVYLGEPDAVMFKEHPELSFVQESTNSLEMLFEPDEVIREGDILKFGNVTIECKLVPGHTAGCVALFFDVSDGEKTVRAGYYGGFGFNTLTKAYLTEIGDTEFQMRKVYIESIDKVKDEKVELFLGNHTENNKFFEKLEKRKADPDGKNPFINDHDWKEYLEQKKAELEAFSAKGC